MFFVHQIFCIGLVIVYLQLRSINQKRDKWTNIGGVIGLFGLFVILLMSQSFWLAVYTIKIIPDSLTIYGFILGSFLVFTGIFTESTRFDEFLIHWVKTNIGYVARLILFFIALFLMFAGIINWFTVDEASFLLYIAGYFIGLIWPSKDCVL